MKPVETYKCDIRSRSLISSTGIFANFRTGLYLKCLNLTHFWSMFLFHTPGNTRKTLMLWCFQGLKKGNIGQKWVNNQNTRLVTNPVGFYLLKVNKEIFEQRMKYVQS